VKQDIQCLQCESLKDGHAFSFGLFEKCIPKKECNYLILKYKNAYPEAGQDAILTLPQSADPQRRIYWSHIQN